MEVADEVLARAGVPAQVSRFGPAEVHAVLLLDRAARHERDRVSVLDELDADGPWAALLGGAAPTPVARAAFVLNAANLGVCRLAQSRDRELQRVVVEALYGHALVAGHHPIGAFDAALVARALPALIDRALDPAPTTPGDHTGGSRS